MKPITYATDTKQLLALLQFLRVIKREIVHVDMLNAMLQRFTIRNKHDNTECLIFSESRVETVDKVIYVEQEWQRPEISTLRNANFYSSDVGLII